MAEEGFKRKLTAILSADAVGYSRLMAEDEAATVKTVATYREVMSTLIKQHRGRVVDSPGDNVLAEFGSVVDAVQCGVAIQNEFQARNGELPENRRMEFRIGINLGDVIEEEDRIYGDGVNIAARLESLADPGGICVSKTAFDQIETKLPFGYEYIGEQQVKNIPKPVGAYRVLMDPRVTVAGVKATKVPLWRRKRVLAGVAAVFFVIIGVGMWNFYFREPLIEPVSEEEMAFPLPDKPSVAVLPFANIGHPEQEYIADGITEQIITNLAMSPELFVIASNSTFTYKGKPVMVQQVSRELGVRYVVEGSVQKSGDRIRITAQLIDALKGEHIWAEKYDRDLKNIFALQDEIALNILKGTLGKVLGFGDLSRLKGTTNVGAFLKFLKSRPLNSTNERNNRLAQQLLEESIALDPKFALAYSNLGVSYCAQAMNSWSQSPGKDLQRAYELAQKAIGLDQKLGIPHGTLGWFYLLQGKHDKAIAEAKKAVDLTPNSAWANGCLGTFLGYADRPDEAIVVSENALRLNPFPTDWDLLFSALGYIVAGRYEEALLYNKKAQKRNPANIWSYFYQAGIYGHLGRQEEAAAAAKELLRLNPKFAVKQYEKTSWFKNREKWNLIISGLRKAGLPEHQPLKLPEKPSIAVLPFDNMSKNPEQEYFADGMTDDLITDLSRISGLFVIARNSTFQYKGKAVDVKKVSRELGIRYVLEGSVRKAGDKVRINAQLIDTTTGGHLWAERYDGQMNDIFSLQDKITQKIVAALAVKLNPGEKENIASKGTENIEAYDAFLKGWQYYLRWTPEDVTEAIGYFKKAIELDPNYYHTYAALALIYDRGARGDARWQKALNADFFTGRLKARHFLNMAMKKPTALAYRVASWMDLRRRRHDEALLEIEKAVAISPNDAEVQMAMARVLTYTGRPKEAIDLIKKVMLLDPNRMAECLYLQGIAHFCMKQYEKSISSFERAYNYNPHFWSEPWLITTYANLGRQEDAELALKRYKKRWLGSLEKTSTGTYTKLDIQPQVFHNPFSDPEVTKRFVDGLIKAGHPKPHRYYEVSRENKLTGDEIRELVFGRTAIGATFAGGAWTIKNGKDGSALYEGYGLKDSGRNWIEGDQICDQYKVFFGGLKKCTELYRNPKGTHEGKDEYLLVNDIFILPVSYVD